MSGFLFILAHRRNDLFHVENLLLLLGSLAAQDLAERVAELRLVAVLVDVVATLAALAGNKVGDRAVFADVVPVCQFYRCAQ